MQKTIISGGSKYIDIDVLASCIAYEEWFRHQAIPVEAILCGCFNETVPQQLREKYPHIKNNLSSSIMAKSFILVDVSNPVFFPAFIDHNKISEIWDHHQGFENYWKKKIGRGTHIDTVGACATLIWEQFVKHQIQDKISTASANLLSIAIISNTLNLQASITKQRDIEALRHLKKYTSLPTGWIEQYYTETDESILNNPYNALIHDKKNIQLDGKTFSIGQLELWSATALLKKHDLVKLSQKALAHRNDLWFLNMPCIKENKNYFITTSTTMQKILSKICPVTFKKNIGVANQLYLRKEMINLLKF